MTSIKKLLILWPLLLNGYLESLAETEKQPTTPLASITSQLKNYDSLAQAKVMVVATPHFNKSVLTADEQQSIQLLLSRIKDYSPTKIILEWEPERLALARWYQRNIRMAANVLKISQPNDRLLIFVGDNHKWVLDSLFAKIPELTLVDSWQYLAN